MYIEIVMNLIWAIKVFIFIRHEKTAKRTSKLKNSRLWKRESVNAKTAGIGRRILKYRTGNTKDKRRMSKYFHEEQTKILNFQKHFFLYFSLFFSFGV